MLSDHDVRRVAAEAFVDAETVKRAFAGKTRSRATRAAIVAALEKLGFKSEARAVERKGKAA